MREHIPSIRVRRRQLQVVVNVALQISSVSHQRLHAIFVLALGRAGRRRPVGSSLGHGDATNSSSSTDTKRPIFHDNVLLVSLWRSSLLRAAAAAGTIVIISRRPSLASGGRASTSLAQVARPSRSRAAVVVAVGLLLGASLTPGPVAVAFRLGEATVCAAAIRADLAKRRCGAGCGASTAYASSCSCSSSMFRSRAIVGYAVELQSFAVAASVGPAIAFDLHAAPRGTMLAGVFAGGPANAKQKKRHRLAYLAGAADSAAHVCSPIKITTKNAGFVKRRWNADGMQIECK